MRARGRVNLVGSTFYPPVDVVVFYHKPVILIKGQGFRFEIEDSGLIATGFLLTDGHGFLAGLGEEIDKRS
jgi:hypothetical protein